MLRSMPQSLSSANIDKMIKSMLADQKFKIDPKQLAKELKSLELLNKSVDTSLFEPTKFVNAGEAEQRLVQLETGAMKAAQAAAAQARKVAALGEKSHAELKANKAVDKEAVGAVGDVAEDAQAYAGDLLAAAQKAVAQVKAEVARLQQLEKKSASEAKKGDKGEDEDDAEHEKDLKVVGTRVATAMKLARDAGPSKPMPFMIGVLKKQTFVYVAKATSGSTVSRIKAWMDAGTQSVTIYRGHCVFQDKAHTFVGVNIPTGGFAMRIQRALMELTNKRYKIRVRRPTGETEEVEGDDDRDADDELAKASQQGGKDAALAERVRERHRELDPLVEQVVRAGGPLVEVAKALRRDFDKNVDAKKFDQALKVLEEIETRVVKAAEAERAARARAEQELAKRLAALMPEVKKALATGGDAAKKVKATLDRFSTASKDAARTAVKGGFDTARRELDNLEKTVDWAISERSASDKAQDVERAAKKMADDATAKAKSKAEAAAQLARQAQAEFDKREKALRKRLDDAIAAGGKGADEVRRLVAEAEKIAADAARAGVKDRFAKAHRALDAAEKAADWVLDAKARSDDLAKQVERQRLEAAKQLAKIGDAAKRAEVLAMMRVVEAERLAAQKLGDAKAQAEAYAKVLKKFESTAATAAKTAAEKVGEKVTKAIDETVDGLGKAAKKIFG